MFNFGLRQNGNTLSQTLGGGGGGEGWEGGEGGGGGGKRREGRGLFNRKCFLFDFKYWSSGWYRNI